MTSAVLGDHGELLAKLKCPLRIKNQDFVAMDQTHHPQSENHQLSIDNNAAADKICDYCNKGFRSGKALGGHVRIHFKNRPELMIVYKKLKSTHPMKFKKRKREEITLADIAKKINFSNRKPSNNGTTGTGTAAVPTCSICSKTFPSMKSLFGHMRCHPNRDWRGIQPPPAVKSASSASLVSDVEPQDSDDQANSAAPVDLTESLIGWSATAKRGRKQAIFDREILAAHELMRLAHGGGLFESSPTSKQRVFEEDEATNSNSFAYKAESEDKKKKKKKKKSFQELSAGYMKGGPHPVKQLSYPNDRKSEDTDKNKADNETGSLAGKSVNSQWEDTSNWPYEAEEDEESASRNSEQLNNGKVIIVKNKKKRKKIKDLESVHDDSPVHQVLPATSDKYRCGTCDKSFPTHQALGGHRSSHNKIRMTIHDSVEGRSQFAGDDEGLADSPMLEDEENKGSEEGAGSSKQVGDTDHKCKICSRKFSTCQEAVGGHKKCQSVAVAPSSQVSSVGELSHTCGGGGRGLDFDLNEVPPVEDDAGFKSERDVGDANCGHASSSFNSVEFPVFESSSSGL